MASLKFNPFSDSAIVNYDQYKKYPFIPFGNWEVIKNRITGQVNQIKEGYFYGERSILIGSRGIGKTTTLFALKDILEENNIRVELFSRLVEDAEHFRILTGENIGNVSMNPLYILIDFPDTLDTKSFKSFLGFLWSLMTHKNYSKINLIFAMNNSHFEKSFSYSEIFGKFITLRLETLKLEEAESLIESRFNKAEENWKNVFDYETLSLIFNYSKGIPRNIVSACNILIENINGKFLTIDASARILQEKYVDQVINDRVEDKEERRILRNMIDIIKNDFNGRSEKQNDYLEKVREKLGLGQVTILKKIDSLLKWGIFSYQKGGEKRRNKILSLT